jgi:hypothetical protein
MNTVRKKMEKAGKTAGLILLAMLVLIAIAEATVSITVTGSWSLSIGQANLTGGAGTDLTSTYTSATDQATLGVSGAGSHSWRIDVLRMDTTWHANLHLWVKRTNNGTSGTGTYSGGTTFLEVTTTTQTFMTGYANRDGFTLQFQLTGVSTAVPAASYSTTIRYTVTQTD